ncbi:ABC transporter substrate-binding protein [Gordonia paraffinivorans]|uniref:ABC transporter substrate-binding protein n=1 Tax=Gordonia paraffinivorans TaxID=175628 RepID=UPI0014488FEA|nr:ABC transporter substrate-binding protein [Gordonia paraffinivorans]
MTTRIGRRSDRRGRRVLVAALAAAVALGGLAACSGDAGPGRGPTDRIVLAEAQAPGEFNPLLGYGRLGVSPIYEGLLAPGADSDERLPDLVPALAASRPERIAPRVWRVPLKTGVTFSDGTPFDSADVVATYRAAVDPAVASAVSTYLAPIVEMKADGPQSVTVTMATDADPSPYLLLGIVPAERVERIPAAQWALNTVPVGTGPYRLDSLDPDQAILVAREDHRDGTPAMRRVVYTHVPDDNSRAQLLQTGEVDGASLPPRLAAGFEGRDDLDVVDVASADWRGVSLPARNDFTADPAARRAMNLGIDRKALVEDVLDGDGEPASTPISRAYGDAYDESAQFPYDRDAAQRVLDAAGWRPGEDGIRVRNGVRASFPLLYNAGDTLRRDLAVAFAAAMKKIGVEVLTRGTSWDEIETKLATAGALLGGGEMPYSIDSQVYDALHTRVPGSSPYSNPGDFTAPGLDEMLDAARESAPGPRNDERYRRIQQIYSAEPSQVFLAFVHHTYVARSAGWTHDAPILEPHSHGVIWGPWWNLPSWSPEA